MSALQPRWSDPGAPQPPEAGVGFAWFTSTIEERTVHWHNGATGGFRTMIAIDMPAQKAIFVVGNSVRPVDPIAWRLLADRRTGHG